MACTITEGKHMIVVKIILFFSLEIQYALVSYLKCSVHITSGAYMDNRNVMWSS